MTEAEWLACNDPMHMLFLLGDSVSERKRRLFACACCREVRKFAARPEYRRALDVVERIANGQAAAAEIYRARPGSRLDVSGKGALWFHEAITSLTLLSSPEILAVPGHAARAHRDATGALDWSDALRIQARILRDLTGHLYHDAAIDPGSLRGQGGVTPRQLAQVIYDDGAFHELPVLADVLEECGCTDAVVLDHCRRPGIHARGCWVVDWLLEHPDA
jgi:hypothetical protein